MRTIVVKIVFALVLSVVFAGMTGCEGGQPRVSVENARAEMSPDMYREGIIYLKIVNLGGKDKLVGLKTTIPGATASLHEMKGDFMVIAPSITIPAKNTVDLMPMGSHIMVENMPKNVQAGYSFVLMLVFDRTGEVRLPLTFAKPQPTMREHEHRE